MDKRPRILVCGGRDFGDVVSLQLDTSPENMEKLKQYQFIHRTIDDLVNKNKWWTDDKYYMPSIVIIEGGARGADLAAADYAVANWCGLEEYNADWETHGKKAGPLRNQQMIDEGKPDLVLAFPGGKGTADMVRRAKKHNIDVIEVEYND